MYLQPAATAPDPAQQQKIDELQAENTKLQSEVTDLQSKLAQASYPPHCCYSYRPFHQPDCRLHGSEAGTWTAAPPNLAIMAEDEQSWLHGSLRAQKLYFWAKIKRKM